MKLYKHRDIQASVDHKSFLILCKIIDVPFLFSQILNSINPR